MPAINRYYSSVAIDTTLKFGITSTELTFEVNSTAGFPTSYPYTIAIGYDSSSEELVTVVAASGTILTVGATVAGGGNIAGRGVDGTTDQAHVAGEIVKHVISARDMTESQSHIAAESGAHGITGSFVGTTDTQTLTNKTINSTNNTVTIAQAAVTNLTSDLALKAPLAGPTFTGTVTLPTGVTGATGAVTSNMIADGTIVNADINASAAIDWTKLAVSSTVSATEIGYVDGVTSAIQTQIDSKIPKLYTIPAAKTGAYTLTAGDEVNLTELNGTFTVTIPLDSTYSFPIGSTIDIINIGTGVVTTAGAAGVTLNGTPGLKLRTQWSSASFIKRAANTWVIVGDLGA